MIRRAATVLSCGLGLGALALVLAAAAPAGTSEPRKATFALDPRQRWYRYLVHQPL